MESKYLKRIIKSETLPSTFLGVEKPFQVYLPPEYKEYEQYPVLLLHDGDDYFNLGRIATQANQLIAELEIEPIVMVAVPVDKAKRNEEYSPNGTQFRQHQQFIIHELLPYIEQHYPVDLSPEQLVIGGSSLGGTASLHLAMDYPDRVKRVLAQSGAFLDATIDAITEKEASLKLDVYQTIGKDETAIQTHFGTLDLVARNREVAGLLKEKGATVQYIEKQGNHTWGYWQEELPDILRYFF